MSASIVFVLLMAAADHFSGAAHAAAKPQPMIVVEATYPGADAAIVADTVAKSIENQVDGVENMLRMESRSSEDGRYLLAVTFKPGMDVNLAKVLVQNRVALALPGLPLAVQLEGVSVTKKAPLRLIVSLTSTGARYDAIYLSNYATTQIKDELARVPGVGSASLFGLRDSRMRVQLDPDKLATFNLTAKDVADAIAQQNVQVASGLGQPPKSAPKFELTITSLGRLTDPKEFGEIILKSSMSDGKTSIVRLKDVGRVEMGAGAADQFVSLNGKTAVVLGVCPIGETSPEKLSRAVADKIAMLSKRLPKGLKLEVAFDFTANLEATSGPKNAEYLLLDLELPVTAAADRVHEALALCDKSLRDVGGVQDVLVLTENPFDTLRKLPCVLVRLAPSDKRKVDRQEMMRTIRMKLEKIPDMALRMRDLSRPGGFPRCGYPIDLAVSGPEADKVLELTQKLAERMRKSQKLTDVWPNPESTLRPRLYLDIDRAKLKSTGVTLDDIVGMLDAIKRADDLKQLKVRNNEGKMVALASIVTAKTPDCAVAIYRLNMSPMVEITANPGTEASLAQARAFCETALEQLRKEAGLPGEYRLSWLGEIPTSK
jgi:multidrug efflux pump subunit AcrB